MKHILSLLLIIFVGLFSFTALADTKDDAQNLVSFMKSDVVKKLPEDTFSYYEQEDEDQIIRDWTLFEKVQLCKGKDWRWVEHFVYYREHYLKETKQTFKQLTIIIKEKYSALSPDSHTYVEWIITDPSINGRIHRVMRDWIIVMENYKNDEGYNIRLIPQWPPEFMKFIKWLLNPSKADGQFKYEIELSFWMSQIKKWEK